jgi:deoxycytidine triphosphate deaminase
LSIIPFVTNGPDLTVVETAEEYERKGGSKGRVALIHPLDRTQPVQGDSNASYDLRIGNKCKDHRGQVEFDLRHGGQITIFPGSAMIVETQESVTLPRTIFGYVVPRVSLLQRGLSNTFSKVDPGYNGLLLVTLFNLGKQKIPIQKGDKVCSLVLHQVAEGATVYEKPGQSLLGRGPAGWLRRILDALEGHAGATQGALLVVNLLLAIFNVVVFITWWWHQLHVPKLPPH